MAAHKDIRILFTVEGRHYEAVGFLSEGEPPVGGDEMFSRTAAENGGAVGEGDEAFLSEHRDRLPESLRPYWLVTNRRNPDYPRYVSCFGRSGNRWCQGWRWLDYKWYDYDLIVRRA